MNFSDVGDPHRRLHATAANQTGTEDPLSKFAYLLDHTSVVQTQLFEHISPPASGVPSSKETRDHPLETVETATVQARARLIGDVQPQEPSRHVRGWKSKAFALAGFFVIGTLVAVSSWDYVRGQAEGYGSMLLDGIAGLDDAPTLRASVIPDGRVAQRPSSETAEQPATPSTAEVPPVADNAQSARARADSSEEVVVDASTPAAPVAPASATNATANRGATTSGVGVSNVTPVARTVDAPLASMSAAAPLAFQTQGPQPKAVRTVSVRSDRTRISSAAGSIETSTAGDAVKVSAKPLSDTTNGSAGTEQASNPSSDLQEIPSGKSLAGVAANPSVAAEMPSPPPKPAKRQKRGKSEKSTNAPKVDAAEAATNAPATPVEPPSDQGSGNPPPGSHAGRL